MSSMRVCIASFVRILKTIRFGVHTSMDEQVDDKKEQKIYKEQEREVEIKTRDCRIYTSF